MLNSIDFDLVILLLLSTIILSIVMAVISIKIAPKVGLMDYPDSAAHKIHKNAIPLTGGIFDSSINAFISLIAVRAEIT